MYQLFHNNRNKFSENIYIYIYIRGVNVNARSQENVLLYLFRNTFDNSWVNVSCKCILFSLLQKYSIRGNVRGALQN